ncbi:MAG TPA: Ig-like domain-containing protein [Acidiferrobacterales bacterium]
MTGWNFPWRGILVTLALPLWLVACTGGADTYPAGSTVPSTNPPPPSPPPSPDTSAPSVSIASPSGATTVTASPITVSGSASDNVGVTQVSWSTNSGGSGNASRSGSGTSITWNASVPLVSGSNTVTVTARDAAGNASATRSVTVTYNPPPPSTPDTTAPSLSITSPSGATTVTASPITVSGSASDNVGVTQVSWTNDRGGSGTATGTTSWSASVPLVSGSNTVTVTARDAAGNASAPRSVTVTYNVPAPLPPPSGSNAVGVQIQNLSGSSQSDVPVTFAQPFKPGQIASGASVAVRTTGGSSVGVPAQVDIKARHADGSVRHAVITLRLANLAGGATQGVELVSGSASGGTAVQLSELLATGFDAAVSLNISGTVYSASARSLLQAGPVRTWLSGPMVSEWLVAAPVKAGSNAHPHLNARFAIRAYKNSGGAIDSVRADVTLENNWAYEPSPRNFGYDATVSIAGSTVYTKTGLTHYRQSRWRKVYWWGKNPNLHVRHDRAFLASAGVIPNYDPSLVVPESALSGLASSFSGSKTEPMGAGLASLSMPDTGAREDIGPLPRWTAFYLISQDSRAKTATLGTGDLAGSWPIHYRDKNTDRPVSLNDYPYMTLLGNLVDSRNPSTGQYEAFPDCGGSCTTPFIPDSAHQPSLAYVPYLVTGDHYHLEELQFWANWNILRATPVYRELDKGLIKWEQVRGQAWSLRTLGQAAFITPDGDPMKSYLQTLLANNLSWYRQTYPNNAGANALGVIANGYAFEYKSGTGIAAWQDDFFTWSIGHVAALGYADAQAMLVWKARFPISRMVGPGYCWIYGAPYETIVKSSSSGPVFSTIAEVYVATAPLSVQSLACGSAEMASALGRPVGDMGGYSSSPTGYPSNMQPALAVAADSGAANGAAAWLQFMSRSVKPDYSSYPNFAIVPRQ